MSRFYTYQEIIAAYRQAGVCEGGVVLVRGNLGLLHAFEDPGKEAILAAHYKALREIVGSQGTIVVPTGNLSLCNTETPFDPHNTPSWRLGSFSEYIRTMEGAMRRRHPFVSYAAIGPDAEEITQGTSRHAYGPASSKDRLIGLNAHAISAGLPPNRTASIVHHSEQMMAVPYRYTKEFMHPVVQPDGPVKKEPFYMYVTYRECDLQRNQNVKLWERFNAHYPVKEASLGHGTVWGYKLAEFHESCIQSFTEDIYIWLDHPPEIRPYRE